MDKNKIEAALISMGTPLNLIGYNYIVDIVYLLDQPEWILPKWNSLYYCVANLNNTTPSSVEKAIRTALRITRDRCNNYKNIEHYIGFENCENSNSLMMLHKMIKIE